MCLNLLYSHLLAGEGEASVRMQSMVSHACGVALTGVALATVALSTLWEAVRHSRALPRGGQKQENHKGEWHL